MNTATFLQQLVTSGEIVHGDMRVPARPVTCADGFKISIQAGTYHYSLPRNTEGPYIAFELGFPSEADPLINEYADDQTDFTGTVYPYVPLAVVVALIDKHGGIKPTT